jgi:hypothetical protein
MAGGLRRPVPDRQVAVTGMAGAPELACQLGDLGRRPAAAPVPERQVAGGGAAGCRSFARQLG